MSASRPLAARTWGALASGALALCASVTSLPSQTVGGTSMLITPTIQQWSFASAVPLDSLSVASAHQITVPFLAEMAAGGRWTLSVSGAVFASTVEARRSTGSISRSLSGLTDTRLRATGRLLGDRLQLTAGLTVPSGPSGLSPEQNDVLRVLSAPALGAAVAIPATGLGGTLGLLSARRVGDWALAGGLSVEQRGRYAPLEVALLGRSSRTELVPGPAVHASAGLDGVIGTSRLTVGMVADIFGRDAVEVSRGGATTRDRYRLGPALTASGTLQISHPVLRNLTIQAVDRYRAAYSDSAGAVVAGSSGNYFDASASALIGPVGHRSLVVGLTARQHTGLGADAGFIGAGVTSGGFLLGLSLPTDRMEWRPTVQLQTGQLRTARITTAVRTLVFGLSASLR